MLGIPGLDTERRRVMAKFIEFEIDDKTVRDQHPIYRIINKGGGYPMGTISWYPRWRQWTADFDPGTTWSRDCLADVCEFMRVQK